MSETQKKFYITTPIYYVNARPHIGHAYSTVIADVIARRHRLLGDDVFFLTGTDEHGQKIERSAAAAGIPPKEFADQVSETFRSLWKRMGITNDDFIRTTEPRHKQGVQKLFEALRDRGFIYLDTYTGQYCVSDEAYVEVGPGEPCPDCGRITETISESNYYFRLSAFQDKLIEKIESNELLIQPDSRRNEVLSFIRGNVVQSAGLTAIGDPGPLEQGLSGYEISNGLENGRLRRSQSGSLYAPGALKDLSVSRTSFKWGIPVPGDEGHVIYVWLDALANYITAVGYPDLNDERWKYWPANIHLVGKEIIRFHSVYWPAFLMAADLPLPRAIVANGWLLFEESKMSKSRGNVVRTETILDAFGSLEPELSKAEQDLFATDVLRYFLLREVPFGQDGGFSFDALWGRYNSELVNGYGNLVSRALSLIHQTQEGVVPDHAEWANVVIQVLDRKLPLGGFAGHPTDFGEFLRTPDVELARVATIAIHFQDRAFPAMRFSTGADFDPLSSSLKIPPVEGQIQVKDSNFGVLDYVALLVGKTDELFSSTKPWKLAKQDYDASRAELREVLYTAAEAIRITTALLYPILPYATAQVWSQLGLGSIEEAAKNGELKDLKWGGLKPGTKLGPLSPIFPRAPKELIQIMADTESANAPNGVPPAAPPSSPNKSSLILEENPTAAESHHPTDPAAGPRTASLPSENSGSHVAASAAITTERHGTPPHGEAAASGVFANSATGSASPDTPQIAIDDFVKIDLRVAQIVVAERIPKADKLLRLEVDLGYEKRQILSGIAEWYTPEELVGRRIVVIANLAPRKMRGLESHGMLLAASHGENGKPVLATFGEEIALGSRLR